MLKKLCLERNKQARMYRRVLDNRTIVNNEEWMGTQDPKAIPKNQKAIPENPKANRVRRSSSKNSDNILNGWTEEDNKAYTKALAEAPTLVNRNDSANEKGMTGAPRMVKRKRRIPDSVRRVVAQAMNGVLKRHRMQPVYLAKANAAIMKNKLAKEESTALTRTKQDIIKHVSTRRGALVPFTGKESAIQRLPYEFMMELNAKSNAKVKRAQMKEDFQHKQDEEAKSDRLKESAYHWSRIRHEKWVDDLAQAILDFANADVTQSLRRHKMTVFKELCSQNGFLRPIIRRKTACNQLM
eukprot:6209126-Pleurochrysis_carterae.AAC.2